LFCFQYGAAGAVWKNAI